MDMHLITFGPDHLGGTGAKKAVTVFGCGSEEARGIALALYGQEWSGLYSGEEAERYLSRWEPTVVRTVTIQPN